MVRYLTGAINAQTEAIAHRYDLGMLITPDTDSYRTKIERYPFWAADNACFNHPERFVTERYLEWLNRLSTHPRCVFATAPDVVGNAAQTLERSCPVLPLIRQAGYPAALVAQDGIETHEIPWAMFDVLFIGGSTEWKLSAVIAPLVADARMRGKHVHMGRVNSERRLRFADRIGCHTADGNFIAFGPKINLPKLCKWIDRLREEHDANLPGWGDVWEGRRIPTMASGSRDSLRVAGTRSALSPRSSGE